MSDVIVRVEGLGKKYRIRHEGMDSYATLRDAISSGVRGIFQPHSRGKNGKGGVEEFWALYDVNFEVRRGDVVGVIGRNGAGKSTLLKILSRITEPTAGRVTLRGRVASLLEVGTGFHPELTGRENILLNGAILGMQRAEIRRKFDEIVAFAEVERFIDTPVKHYSSGMFVRLAFAVAAHLEPEILIVDEVLAVGDAAFQRKCLGKMDEVSGQGRTILFVSHQMQAVRQMCSRAIWLEGGKIAAQGRSDQVVDTYLKAFQQQDTIAELNRQIRDFPLDPAFRLDAVDIAQDGRSTTDLVSGKPVEIRVAYDVLEDTHGLHVYFVLYDTDGSMIFESLHNGDAEGIPFMARGSYLSTATIPGDFLAGRPYELRIAASIASVRECLPTSLRIALHAHNAGRVNRAYSGYETPGKIAPLIPWRTENRRAAP